MANLTLKESLRYIKWHLSYKKCLTKINLNVLSFADTVNLIIKNRMSVSRFGDGEFRFMLSKDTGDTFEVNSNKLAQELNSTLINESKNILICLPSVYDNLRGLKLEEKVFWQREISLYLNDYYKYLSDKYLYGDAFFSRPYQSYRLSEVEATEKFNLIKKIWNDRDVILVEGTLTRFGVGNDLLKDTKSVRRIIAPAKNAFERINEIYLAIKNILDKSDEDVLILLSLGPTATILSSWIATKMNRQAIDIGHLDIEYEWFLRRARHKVPIKGKYVNEVSGKKFIETETDINYSKEVICRIE